MYTSMKSLDLVMIDFARMLVIADNQSNVRRTLPVRVLFKEFFLFVY